MVIALKNIVLCGFMGSGKSSVGIELATCLDYKFIDMDDYIEAREKMNIPAIFEMFGEEHFRKREHEAVLEIAGMSGLVVASGGGALTRPENTRAFQKNGKIVFLNVSFNECYSRIEKTDRPLVKKNSREQLERIYNERADIYRRAADIEINTTGTPSEIAEAIVNQL